MDPVNRQELIDLAKRTPFECRDRHHAVLAASFVALMVEAHEGPTFTARDFDAVMADMLAELTARNPGIAA